MKMKQKRLRMLVLAVIAAPVLSFCFQNCARQQTQFAVDKMAAYLDGELPADAKVAEFNAEESVEYPSTQLVLVIDNSHTMKQSQEELISRIDNLLASMANKKVAVRILSTSSYTTSVLGRSYGSLKTGKEVYVTDEKAIAANDTQAIYRSSYAPNPTAFILNPVDAVDVRKATVDNIKKTVRAMGVEGSDNESGLCSVIQWASNAYKKTNENEKVVFFVLTDEDNYQGINHCNKEIVNNYDLSSAVPYKQVSLLYQFKGLVYRDGAESTLAERTFPPLLKNIRRTANPSELVGKDCSSIELNEVKNIVASYPNSTRSLFGVSYFFKDAELLSCKYVETHQKYYISEDDLKGIDYCKQPFKSVSNIMSYLAGSMTGVSETQPCQMEAPKRIITRTVRESRFFTKSTNLAESFLSDMSKTQLRSNYFMAVLMNKRGQSCELKSGNSYGDTFENLQKLNPGEVKTYSLCKDDDGYTQAFDKIAAAVSFVEQEFSLVVPAGASLRDVVVIRSGGQSRESLSSDQYVIHEGKLKINSQLRKGDKIIAVMF